jgi:N-acetylglucosaminyldiphosphoundecaprenol N-acetyl-beta-D-mannosaminyltransferase
MSIYPRPASVDVLGVRVDNVTTAETLALLDRCVAERTPCQVATVNPEFIAQAQQNAAFRVALDENVLNLPDGVGLLWAARVLGHPLRERVTGSDTVPLLARQAAQRGQRLFLLGAAPGVAEQAAAVLRRANPALHIVGTYAGSPEVAEEEAIIARVVAAAPDYLFVAYGAPRQDLWIHRNLRRLGVPVCMGVGGTFDFIAGIVPRAPRWMREAGLEWLYRLLSQPWRWKRMLALPRFAYLVWQQARRKRPTAEGTERERGEK